jgi:hypothetical protein
MPAIVNVFILLFFVQIHLLSQRSIFYGLLDNFGIDSTKILSGNKAKDKFRIRIPKREVPKLQALVKDIMPPTMRYRVGLS